MEIVIFSAHIDGVTTRKDRSVKVSLVSALEMTDPNELAKLFSLSDQPVSVAMKVGRVSNEEAISLPEPEEDYRGEKSPGQRLRAVLYKLWEGKGKPQEFELFYKRYMERIIDQFKEKL